MKTKSKHTKILGEANPESISGLFHFYFNSLVGEKIIQVIHGCNCENTTVLAVASADGKVMDLVIIYKGKNLQSSWLGKKKL